MGPEVPWPNGAHGAREAWRGGSGPRKKNTFTNWAGFGSQVGPGYEKTRPEPDPLSFLLTSSGNNDLMLGMSIQATELERGPVIPLIIIQGKRVEKAYCSHI